MPAATKHTARHCHPRRGTHRAWPQEPAEIHATLPQTGTEGVARSAVWAPQQSRSLVYQVYIPRLWLGTNVSAGPAVAAPAEANVPRTRVCSKGRGGHAGFATGSSLLTTAKLLKRSSFFFFKENLLEL